MPIQSRARKEADTGEPLPHAEAKRISRCAWTLLRDESTKGSELRAAAPGVPSCLRAVLIPAGRNPGFGRDRLVGMPLCLMLALASIAVAQSGGGNDLNRTTIDAGGVLRSTGGDSELSGTIGQADAGIMAGGDLVISGGFWFEIPVGDCDHDGVVGRGDMHSFAGCADGPASPFGAAECACSDFDGDGDIDLRDFAQMQNRLSGT